ncbi:SPRY-domain-containing protein [Cystobasidium minutum MCA 4210]|uniref:SPRY-domain-containing protein n=1 Tax=Cystobasidium minutum MCA 4210 TaxID=1397322 RepID=UPI0034D01634|eukprot:jgi/Rhomi1/5256/CE5255_1897
MPPPPTPTDNEYIAVLPPPTSPLSSSYYTALDRSPSGPPSMSSFLFTGGNRHPSQSPSSSVMHTGLPVAARAGGPSSTSSISTNMAQQPTIVMPQEWDVPSYLKHSIFHSRFTVSPSSVPPIASTSTASLAGTRAGGSTAITTNARSDDASWGSAISTNSLAPIEGAAASSSSAVRVHTEGGSASDRYQECLDTPHAKIPLPSRLDPKQCCKRLLIQDGIVQFCPEKDDQGRDKLNRHDPEKDAAAVRADYPIPPLTGIYYFEVDIVSKGQKGYIGIGFSSRAVDLERLPGWNPESYGYHGDDGKAFACSGTGQAYSERFGSGDIIGCGIDFVAKRAFFVKNGKWLGYVFDLSYQLGEREDPTLKPGYGAGTGTTRRDRERGKSKETPGTAPLLFYPTIGLQTPGETVKVNFGQEPFKFDIESFVKRRQRESTASVLSHPIPLSYKRALAPSFPSLPTVYPVASTSTASIDDPTDNDDPHVKACMENLIASYLNYRGYSDTARSFRKQRENERKQWRDVVAESSVSNAASTSITTGDATSTVASGSSTPAKKKGKKKSEGGSKKLLKSALRTTLGDNDSGMSTPQMASQEDQAQSGAAGQDEDEDMQAASDLDRSLSRATPAGVQDDYMTTDVKRNPSSMDDLEADEAELEDTLHRQDICSALRKGRIDYAMREIEDHYPGVILPSSKENLEAMLNGKALTGQEEKKRKRADLLFKLRCRKFVELVLASAAEADRNEDDVDMEAEPEDDEDEQVASQLISSNGAPADSASTLQKGKGKLTANSGTDGRTEVTFDQVLAYGAQLNSLYPPNDPNTSPRVLSHLKLLFSLVAYANPADLSSHGNKAIYDLTRQEERDKLAEEVNKAMLESKGQPGIPHLELVYKQAHAVRNVLADMFGDGRAALLESIEDI